MGTERRPATWVEPLAEAQEVGLSPEEAQWWGSHLDGFPEYCRTHPLERRDLRIAARAYFEGVSHADPPAPA